MACSCDEQEVLTAGSRYTYVGANSGAYEQVTELKYVGEGQGSIHKEVVTEAKPAVPWVWCFCLVPLLFLPFLPFFFVQQPGYDVPVQPAYHPPAPKPKEVIIRHHVIHRNKVVHVSVPVPEPPHVVYDKVYAPHASYECINAETAEGKLWSAKHKAWCCWKMNVACKKHVVVQDKYIHVTKNHAVPVPHYYKVEIPPKVPEPIYKKVPVPSAPLAPIKKMVPFHVPGKRPPPVVHYKYQAVEKPYDVPHTVYHKKEVKVPVIVKRYVKDEVPEAPEVITKTEHEFVPEKGYDCVEGFHNWQDLWNEDKRKFCCWKRGRGCPQTHYATKTEVKTRVKYVDVPVPSPPKIIERTHKEHLTSFNCNEGYSNWYHGWSPLKKKFCCAHEDRGCPGAEHGHGWWELHMKAQAHAAAGGHAKGKIYDCHAGFSNWLQGWSDSKKQWCCSNEQKGCAEHHCFTGDMNDWAQDKKDWCCSNYQRGCAHTTLSPLGCDAVCTLHSESSTCHDRIHWVKDHVFGSRDNNCALAYSKVQVDCDVCRACTIEAMGCQVGGGGAKPAFDCNAALGNFARAWSPPKKQWCCSKQGKGCEGNSPPAVDPGFGMQWKHMQVSGIWTWVAVHAGGGAVVPNQKPYDCGAGRANWQLGWSDAKKGWCCANEHINCGAGGAAAGGAAAGAAGGAAGGSWSVSHSYTVHGHGHPPSAAAAGMMWQWQSNHWVQVHMGHEAFACHAGLNNWKIGWSSAKKDWCCEKEGLGCQ